MNRFKYVPPTTWPIERELTWENNVRLYDGDVKTDFEGGELLLTTHRILWAAPGAIANNFHILEVHLKLVLLVEEESPSVFSFKSSKKVVLHLAEPDEPHADRPVPYSKYNHVKLSFKDGYTKDIVSLLNDCIQRRYWNMTMSVQEVNTAQPHSAGKIKLRSGIVGIERSLQEKQKATDESLTAAFQDLNKLMSMAKDMVRLSRQISTKIKEKQGDITEDETVRFKSYLLSLGIEDPVTRDSYKSNSQYYKGLASEIAAFLQSHIEEVGGMMALTDVYCRINRARGLELLSPEDVLNACKLMEAADMPLKLFQFNSGVMVLQLKSLDGESIAEATACMAEDEGSLTSEELSRKLGISVTLARERLLTAEKYGKVCRDDSIEGLRFYPNLFLTKEEN